MKADSTDKVLAAIAHLGFLSGIGFFFAPLIIWLLKKEESPFLAHHAKQAMVYQGSTFLLMSLLGIGGTVMSFLTAGLGFFLLIPGLGILSILLLVPSVMATIKAANEEEYYYPVCGEWARTL